MGVVNSCCIPRRTCECGGKSSSKGNGEKRGYHRSLSATFNLSVRDPEDVGDNTSCLVNINTATEEELMTLRGIDRTTAKNIIEHRHHIGGFRCIEDIALVSGVGAAKYVQIQHDIYIPSTLEGSPNLIHRGSNGVVITSPGDKSSSPIVSVNTANVFSLIRVKGIGMATAKNIVDYREKFGKFNCLDELKKVKGIGPMLLESIKSWLTVDEKSENKKISSSYSNKYNDSRSNRTVHPILNGGNRPLQNSSSYERRSTSSIENLLEILGPLAKVPVRPEVKPVPLKYKNKVVLRLASWNLQKFSKEKAMNPGVKDVICMTILENRFGIIAVQELFDKDALKESIEYHGFLYDESQNINLITSSLLQSSSDQENSKPFTRMPYLAVFKINNAFDCAVVSVHLNARDLGGEDKKRNEEETDKLSDVVNTIHSQLKDEDDIIILGDFNLRPNASAFDDFRHHGYHPTIPSTTHTNISQSNPDGSENYDNIWLGRQTRCLMAGESGVVREGLYSPWIPDGWSWGGVVSDHCPVYTQLYACSDLDKDGDITVAKEACFEV